MKKRYIFEPQVDICGQVPGCTDLNTIRDEPMFHRVDPRFAREHGGPLTKMVLDKLPTLVGDWVIDTRSHMLMPGHYPAMPGWHCDGVPRTLDWGEGLERASRFQPNLAQLNPNVMHYAVTVSSQPQGVSFTNYLLSRFPVEVEEDSTAEGIWTQVSRQVENELKAPDWHVQRSAHDGEIVRFSMPSLHGAQPAFAPGWRWFFRASPSAPAANEFRKQSMVYVAHGQGW